MEHSIKNHKKHKKSERSTASFNIKMWCTDETLCLQRERERVAFQTLQSSPIIYRSSITEQIMRRDVSRLWFTILVKLVPGRNAGSRNQKGQLTKCTKACDLPTVMHRYSSTFTSFTVCHISCFHNAVQAATPHRGLKIWVYNYKYSVYTILNPETNVTNIDGNDTISDVSGTIWKSM